MDRASTDTAGGGYPPPELGAPVTVINLVCPVVDTALVKALKRVTRAGLFVCRIRWARDRSLPIEGGDAPVWDQSLAVGVPTMDHRDDLDDEAAFEDPVKNAVLTSPG